jgi:hypothetical protein
MSTTDPDIERIARWLEERYAGSSEKVQSLAELLRLGEGVNVLPYPELFELMAVVMVSVLESSRGGETFPYSVPESDRAKLSRLREEALSATA